MSATHWRIVNDALIVAKRGLEDLVDEESRLDANLKSNRRRQARLKADIAELTDVFDGLLAQEEARKRDAGAS